MSDARRVTVEDGVELSVRVVGAGPLDVLLVHGWMASGAVWDAVLPCLDAFGVRWIIPDQRGSGGSDKPAEGYAIDRYVDDLLAVLDAVDCKQCVLVGHSMGGQLALALAAKAPERVKSVCALCPVPPAGLPLPADAAGLFRTSANDRAKQQTILSLACKTLADAERERLLDAAGAVSAPCIEQAFDAWTGGGIADRMSAVRAPLLVVATDDPFLPPAFLREAVVAKVSGARMTYLPGPGHYPQNERPIETAAIIDAFVTGSSR